MSTFTLANKKICHTLQRFLPTFHKRAVSISPRM